MHIRNFWFLHKITHNECIQRGSWPLILIHKRLHVVVSRTTARLISNSRIDKTTYQPHTRHQLYALSCRLSPRIIYHIYIYITDYYILLYITNYLININNESTSTLLSDLIYPTNYSIEKDEKKSQQKRGRCLSIKVIARHNRNFKFLRAR